MGVIAIEVSTARVTERSTVASMPVPGSAAVIVDAPTPWLWAIPAAIVATAPTEDDQATDPVRS